MSWKDMRWWNSGEKQVIDQNLKDIGAFYPGKQLMYRALRELAPSKVKVAIIGQDPYPAWYATGLAFDVPESLRPLPLSLQNIFKEYCSDLTLSPPSHGSLEAWVKQGVLLWNTLPSCTSPLSHDWVEYQDLNRQVINQIEEEANNPVFVLVGAVARRNRMFIQTDRVIEVSHPSPRGAYKRVNPFIGSRLFTRTNELLVAGGNSAVDWRIPNAEDTETLTTDEVFTPE